ncbi:MAG: RNA polymerase-binding protein DksA, partial [Alphaproteobacteria bacterium]|nr:RNA polymerase-binding protein DksA [Alphaproteobacteria bacterium]
MATRLPKNYVPSDDEPFMNARQREYFRRKLADWKDDIIRGTRETVVGLQNESVQHPDDADRAASEAEKTLELRTRDRHRKLINKIDAALQRLE